MPAQVNEAHGDSTRQETVCRNLTRELSPAPRRPGRLQNRDSLPAGPTRPANSGPSWFSTAFAVGTGRRNFADLYFCSALPKTDSIRRVRGRAARPEALCDHLKWPRRDDLQRLPSIRPGGSVRPQAGASDEPAARAQRRGSARLPHRQPAKSRAARQSVDGRLTEARRPHRQFTGPRVSEIGQCGAAHAPGQVS
jgi:hypothetical protein